MSLMTSQAAVLTLEKGQRSNIRDEWNRFSIGLGLLNKDLNIESCNDKLAALFACKKNQVLHQSILSFTNADAELKSIIYKELENKGSWTGIAHVQHMALRMDISIYTDQSEKAYEPSYSVALIDYTEDYQKLRALSAAKSHAEKTDKAKSAFLSHMSHELRTPLNAILGFTQLMQVADELSEMQTDNLKEIETAGNFLLSLINEILDLSKIESGKIRMSEECIALDRLLAECIRLINPMAEKSQISTGFDIQTSKQLLGDHVRLKQVLLNLLSNAVKYNRNGGEICINCFESGKDKIRIEIRDTGAGIPFELQQKIFTPFERLGVDSNSIEGTGIGLMITRRLVQLMHGEIGLLSESGRGSIFWVELPTVQIQDEYLPYKNSSQYAINNKPVQPLSIASIGLDDHYNDLLQRIADTREHMTVNKWHYLHDATSEILQTRPDCILLSSTAAHDLSLDTRNLLSLKKLSLLVVETGNAKDSYQIDTGLFNSVLDKQHSIHDLLKILDSLPLNN